MVGIRKRKITANYSIVTAQKMEIMIVNEHKVFTTHSRYFHWSKRANQQKSPRVHIR